MRNLIIFGLTLITMVSTFADSIETDFTPQRVDAAIRSGAVGAEIAERAKRTKNLHVSEIKGERIPYQLFQFSDYRAGYTLLVENKDRLVILCEGFGGGLASDFDLKRTEDRVTLTFHYIFGSGRTIQQDVKYVLGSGIPELVGSPRDITNER